MNVMSKEPGYDGDPLVEVMLRDPDGEGKRELRVMRRFTQIDKLIEEGKLDPFHGEAAEKFWTDAQTAAPMCSSSGEFMVGGHRTTFTPADAVLMAARRCSEARARLRSCLTELGPRGEIFAVAVLLNRSSYIDACRFCGWPREMGPHALREVLFQIARFYGLAPAGKSGYEITSG